VRRRRLSAGEIIGWSALGVGLGLVSGFALGEWLGDVNRGRVRRVVRSRASRPVPVIAKPAATARAAKAALESQPDLADLGIDVLPVSLGAVELRGWVPNRAARTLAGRVAADVAGVDTVINSILVRGEDDRGFRHGPRAVEGA
jgi:hypothetical protein